jgi:hypothetical protein
MKRCRTPFARLVVGLLLFLPVDCSATTCVATPPLKPIHRLLGVVLYLSGDRIANARVTVLQGATEVVTQQTSGDGKFSVEHLKAGRYDLRIQVEGVGSATTEIVIVQPKTKPRREVAVEISPDGVCPSFSLVRLNQF